MSHPFEPAEPTLPDEPVRYDFDALREKLGQATGRQYWRSLDELADSEGFNAFLHAEFPREASVLDAVGRRQFLQLMGASMALAGLSACTKQPEEKIVPYVKPPEDVVPGLPLFFATALTVGGLASGVLVESHMGRPTKVEGNPDHPASLGATDIFSQAAILGLYDPDRMQVVRNVGQIRPWSAFVELAQRTVEKLRASQGAGFRILSQSTTSPSMASQVRELMQELPQAKWYQYEPVNRDNPRAGTKLAFGESFDAVYRLENADVVALFDADLFAPGSGSVRYIREFAKRRRVGKDGSMNRLYVAETAPTSTGSNADHRLPVRPSEVEPLLRALAAAVGVSVPAPALPPAQSKWVQALAKDLKKQPGRTLVAVGDAQPPKLHALACLINQSLGNVGQTLSYVTPTEVQASDQTEAMKELVADMDAGKVSFLLILGGNPAYTTPTDLRFADRLNKVETRVYTGLYDDETSLLCHWNLPEAHELEAWGDARAFDGTITIQQPLIAPLYEGKSYLEVLGAFTGRPSRSGHDVVRDHWKSVWVGLDFEQQWRRALHDGVIGGSAAESKAPTVSGAVAESLQPGAAPSQGLEIAIRPDPSVLDGRFANNGWLQELPRPLTRLTWDNAALLSPATAERLGLSNEDVVEIKLKGQSVEAPVWIVPGHANDAVTVHLGYGRTRAGRVGNGVGFNAYALRTTSTLWGGAGAELRKTGGRYQLATTQDHFSLEGRDIVRVGTLEEYKHDPKMLPHAEGEQKEEEAEANVSMYPGFFYTHNAWGMSIDLNACVGCNACTIACQSENNIAVVGKDQVARGREMHWIRVDRYFEGSLDNPEIVHQPVPCQQCENAPCELVCPVNATVHGAEGLNDMVYNRCVGTKYCSNNCPYKVRRFNFFKYQDWETESLKPMRNPDVTVRSRGIMEKCTYCVQRINFARIQAKREGREIRDGEIVTACQQVCPAEAIVFGNFNDEKSRIAEVRKDPRLYQLLGELNTRPRTTYLAGVRNPNPELAGGKGEA